MPQTAKVAQTAETAPPQSHTTDTAQENASSLEHTQFQARMRGMNIPPNGSHASINHVVQRIEAGGQHPLQKHEDFMYLQRTIGNQAVIQLLDGMKAAGASKAIGAQAYATEEKIAFSSPSPDLHTTAHEATHVLQQRSGVQLNGGVGKVGDSYERHADAVADLVVKGQSAEGIISQSGSMQRSNPLQRLAMEISRGRGASIVQKGTGDGTGGRNVVQRVEYKDDITKIVNSLKSSIQQQGYDLPDGWADLANAKGVKDTVWRSIIKGKDKEDIKQNTVDQAVQLAFTHLEKSLVKTNKIELGDNLDLLEGFTASTKTVDMMNLSPVAPSGGRILLRGHGTYFREDGVFDVPSWFTSLPPRWR